MHKVLNNIDSQLLCNTIVEGMKDNKAKDITILDLREVDGAVTDFFVICNGDSTTQVVGISDAIQRHTRKELKERPWHQEGKGASEWVLMDYVNVVAHIFYGEARAFYDLEDLWADGKRTDIPNID